MMNAFCSALSVPANGPSVVSSSVFGSTTLTAAIGLRTAASGFLVLGSTKRSRLYLATSALNGEPSWNLTFSRSLKRHVVSLGVSHDVARAGIGASCGSSVTSVSNIAFIMLREKALVVTSGSSDSASTPSTNVASPVAAAAGLAAGAVVAAGAAGAVVAAGAAGAVVDLGAAGALVGAAAGAAVGVTAGATPQALNKPVTPAPKPSSPARRRNSRRLLARFARLLDMGDQNTCPVDQRAV